MDLTNKLCAWANGRQKLVDCESLEVKTVLYTVLHYAPVDAAVAGAGLMATLWWQRRMRKQYASLAAGQSAEEYLAQRVRYPDLLEKQRYRRGLFRYVFRTAS